MLLAPSIHVNFNSYGSPMCFMVNLGVTTVPYSTPIPVQRHWQQDVKAGLDHDVALAVLEPLPIGELVTWSHRMVVCAKKNGQSFQTVDLQALNQHATRETHHIESPFHQACLVHKTKKKTNFDCWNGYYSVAIHTDDRHFTNFIIPWVQYQYSPDVLTSLFQVSQAKRNVLTMHSSGLITLNSVSSKQSTGLTLAAKTA